MDNKKLENKADNKELKVKKPKKYLVIKDFCGIKKGDKIPVPKAQLDHMIKNGYVKK